MRVAIVVAVACLSAVGLCAGQDVQASIRKSTNIPAQELVQALKTLAHERGFQLAFLAEVVGNKRTHGAVGDLTTTEALTELLKGTNLVYSYLDDKTVTILPVNSNSKLDEQGASSGTPQHCSGISRNRSDSATSPNRTSSGAAALNWAGSEGASDCVESYSLDNQVIATRVATAEDAPVQNGDGDSSLSKDSTSGAKLEEITVTATRREESASKVPISMTALTQRSMDDLNIKSVSDLATIVPGLVLTPPFAGAQDYGDIAIRGIFSSANGGFIGNAPTTQLYIDETPIAIRQLGAAASKSPWPNIFDLDRVEVLRGPQGTLFGASAMGGAIRFLTPQPSLNVASGFAKADVGFTQNGEPTYEVGAAYGTPIISGTAGFRVSAWYQAGGGFIDREDPYSGQIVERNANSSEAYVIRPAFTWALSDALSVTTSAFLQRSHGDSPDSYWLNYLPAPRSGEHLWGGIDEPMTDNLHVYSLSIKSDFAGLSFVSDTSYLDRTSTTLDDITQTYESYLGGGPILPGFQSFISTDQNNSFTHAWQQEFRLSSNSSSRLNWVVGAFYRHAVQGLQQIQPPDLTPLTEFGAGVDSLTFFKGVPNYTYNGQVLNGYSNFRTTDVSTAVFGDVAINILPGLKLDAGVRFEHVSVRDQAQVTAGPTSGTAYSYVTLPDATSNPVTPRVSLTYQYTDTGMVYASAAKGFRPGGGNTDLNGNPQCQPSLQALGLSKEPATYSPDNLWSYELGAKVREFDQRLSIEGSVYYIKWSNVQTSVNLPSCGNAYTANQGDAISRGFDLQLAASLTHDLKFGAVVGYTDAYFPNAAYGTPFMGVVPLLNGAGDKLLNVLPWTAAANAEYARSMGSIAEDVTGYIRVDYRWLSGAVRVNPNVANYDPETGPFPNESYGILNVRLGIRHDNFDLSGYINNATNSDPRLGYAHFAPGSPLFISTAVRPLTGGLTLWYRF